MLDIFSIISIKKNPRKSNLVTLLISNLISYQKFPLKSHLKIKNLKGKSMSLVNVLPQFCSSSWLLRTMYLPSSRNVVESVTLYSVCCQVTAGYIWSLNYSASSVLAEHTPRHHLIPNIHWFRIILQCCDNRCSDKYVFRAPTTFHKPGFNASWSLKKYYGMENSLVYWNAQFLIGWKCSFFLKYQNLKIKIF